MNFNSKKIKMKYLDMVDQKIIISSIFKVPKTTKIVNNASKSPKSPTLFKTKALIAALFAESLCSSKNQSRDKK